MSCIEKTLTEKKKVSRIKRFLKASKNALSSQVRKNNDTVTSQGTIPT